MAGQGSWLWWIATPPPDNDPISNAIAGQGVPAMPTVNGSFNPGGLPGFPYPISFAHWQAPKYGNKAEFVWNNVFAAAQLAIALANSLAQQQIADLQQQLAERWLSHAEYKLKRFKNAYKPLEVQLLREVTNQPVPKLNCKNARSRAQESVRGAYTTMQRFLRQKAKAYNVCLHESTDLQQHTMLVDSMNYNYQDDRWITDFLDDRRWNRRSAVLNIGRNNDALAQGYAEVSMKTFGRMENQLNAAAHSAMFGLGYIGAREDTYFPATFLGSAGRGTTNSPAGIGGNTGNINPNLLNPTGQP